MLSDIKLDSRLTPLTCTSSLPFPVGYLAGSPPSHRHISPERQLTEWVPLTDFLYYRGPFLSAWNRQKLPPAKYTVRSTLRQRVGLSRYTVNDIAGDALLYPIKYTTRY